MADPREAILGAFGATDQRRQRHTPKPNVKPNASGSFCPVVCRQVFDNSWVKFY